MYHLTDVTPLPTFLMFINAFHISKRSKQKVWSLFERTCYTNSEWFDACRKKCLLAFCEWESRRFVMSMAKVHRKTVWAFNLSGKSEGDTSRCRPRWRNRSPALVMFPADWLRANVPATVSGRFKTSCFAPVLFMNSCWSHGAAPYLSFITSLSHRRM